MHYPARAIMYPQTEAYIMTSSNTTTNVTTLPSEKGKSLVAKFAEKFSIQGDKLLEILKATAFSQRGGKAVTNEQMAALLVVADQYNLNPFTKEIYAFPDQQNGIVPVVGVDGWSRIINSHKEFDGMDFRFADSTVQLDGLNQPIFEWIECIMYRKDRERPTVIREYMEEIYRPPFKKNGANGPYVIKGPWQTHPRRFARHKVVIQCARMALGYTGIYDEDEAERIMENQTGKTIQQQESITFDVQPEQSLPTPQPQSQVIQDLQQNVELTNFEGVESVHVEQQELEDVPQTAVLQADQGEVSGSDMNMIHQMIEFTKNTNSWKNTKESFEERYSGSTLDYALEALITAQMESQSE